jgi:NAD(P)H-dependent flavin oxidoreductase YrpB (nitropropane dioxygenase family)
MHPTLYTPLCDLLGIEVPVVQTAMGWVATPELVAATCRAGGIGFLAGATMSPVEVEHAITAVETAAPGRSFGVNFLMEQPGAEDIARIVVDRGIRVVSYSRAPRADLIGRFKDAGVLCMPTVGTARHAERAVTLGADVVTVQGGEGGGHTGAVPTSLLLPQVLDTVDVPVVAAGGYRDGRGLVAALAHGAVGIAMGTRFLLTREAPVTGASKQRYLATDVEGTVVTRAIDGLPQRVVRTELVDELESAGSLRRLLASLRSAWAFRGMSDASLLSLVRSGLSMRRTDRLTRSQVFMAANAPVLVRRGLLEDDPEHGVLPSGQIVGLIDDLPTCAELLARILDEAESCLARLTATTATGEIA